MSQPTIELNLLQHGDPDERRKLQSSSAPSLVVLSPPVNAKCHRKDVRAHDARHVAATDCGITGRTYQYRSTENVGTSRRSRHRSHAGCIYEPLFQPRTIRLTEIDPSQGGSSFLSCHLKTVHLDSAPSYEALSYRWCGQYNGFLRCNGKDLSIRQNLKDALKSLRFPNAQRAIWIDAICINQKNEEEKSGQIKLMREIYSKARRVLVWLGKDPDSKAKQAFDRIRRIAQEETTLPPPHDPWWNLVAAFYRHDWFSRLWVFQEVAVATAADVLWGASSIPWDIVGRASIRIRTLLHQQILRYSMTNVYHGYLFYKWSVVNERPDGPESFLYMLQITRKLHCSDQKDRIYALSGFTTVDICAADFHFEVGFKKRLRLVYQEFARKILRRMQTLDILSAVQHDPGIFNVQKLTWVPKWNICTVDTLAPLGSKYQKYSACQGLTSPLIEWTGNWKQFLRATGIEFATITRATEVIPGLTNLREIATVLVEVLVQLFAKMSPYPSGESHAHVCCWTLTAGKDGYGMIVEKGSEHLDDFAAFLANNRHALGQYLPRLPRGERVSTGDANRFLVAAKSACSGRRIFHVSNGYVGIGPGVLQAGDMVCVLSGGAMPFVLRRDSRSRQSKRRFALIGEAYVHGIMHGEATRTYCDANEVTMTFDII